MNNVPAEKVKNFYPVINRIYTNVNGLRYKVIKVVDKDYCWVRCVSSGWTCKVYKMSMTDTGKVEWQHSICGRFENGEM